MNRQERRRERLISLTQTEIMFVLAAVILLLLFAKIDDLTKVQEDLQEARSEIVSMSVAAKESEDAGIIHKIITESGIDPNAPDVAEQVTATLDAMIAENQQLQEVDNVLAEVKTKPNESKSKSSEKEKETRMEKLRKAVKDANAFNEEKRESNADSESEEGTSEQVEAEREKSKSQEPKQEMPPEQSDEYYASVGKATWDALGKESLSPQEVKNRIIKLLVGGFMPCWLREPSKQNRRRYYYAYDITYDGEKDLYKILPHKDMQSTATVVQEALSGGLSILQDPSQIPQGWVKAEAMEEFGKKVKRKKDALYSDKSDCWLMTTINKSASGFKQEFVQLRVGFYPIRR